LVEKRKKILFVHHDSTLAGGGANDDFLRILKHLWFTEKYEIECAFPDGDRVSEYSMYCHKYYFYTKVFFPVRYISPMHYYGFFKLYFKNKREFAKILDKSYYDISLVNVSVLIWPSIFIKKKKIKQIIFIRELVQPEFIQKIILKRLNTLGTFFFSVSESLKKNYIEITGSNNVATINSALEADIDESIVTDSEFYTSLKNLGVQKTNLLESKNLICVGAVNERKNQLLIIKTLAYLKSTGQNVPNIFFAGDTSDNVDYYEMMLKKINKSGISDNVFFLGHADKKNLYKILSRMDALIISSKSEGLPLVLVEALKFNIPVITSNVGGIKDIIVDNVNGIVIGLTEKSLSNAIGLLNDKVFVNKITSNGYSTFRSKFNLEENLKLIVNKIDSLTADE